MMTQVSTEFTRAGRLAAGAVALCAWTGLGLYLAAEIRSQDGDVLVALWNNLGFLTDLTNLFLAIVLTGVALGSTVLSGRHVIGWATTAIVFVGVGFWVIGGRLALGTSTPQDILLHGVTPLAALAVWLAFAPKGGLRWPTILTWLAWPALYWPYALIRGAATGEYAYGFLDPGRRGVASVALMLGELIALYVVIAATIFAIDRAMGRRRR